MEKFKERVIAGLQEMQNSSHGLVHATICACIQLVRNIPDDEHSGEKTCGPDYEAECMKLQKTLLIRESTIEKLEDDLRAAAEEIAGRKAENARQEGFKEGVLTGLRVMDQRTMRDAMQQRCENRRV